MASEARAPGAAIFCSRSNPLLYVVLKFALYFMKRFWVQLGLVALFLARSFTNISALLMSSHLIPASHRDLVAFFD